MLDVDLDLLTNWQGPDTAELRAAQRTVASDQRSDAPASPTEAAPQGQTPTGISTASILHRLRAPAASQNGGPAPTAFSHALPQLEASTSARFLRSAHLPGDPEPHGLAAYCLGSFRLFHDLHIVSPWSSRKGLAVLEYLILQHPAPVPKEVLMDVFWREDGGEAARRNLHQAIYAVRQVFRKQGPGPQALQYGQDHYFLDPSLALWTDYGEFEKHVQAGRRHESRGERPAAITEYAVALGLYQGDLFEDELYDDWPRWRRETLRHTYFDIADRLSEHYLLQHDYPAAMSLSWRILNLDHCHEQAHCRLMKCYMAYGQRHMAVRQYQLCAEALQADLNLSPSQETTALYRQLISEA